MINVPGFGPMHALKGQWKEGAFPVAPPPMPGQAQRNQEVRDDEDEGSDE